MCALNEGHVYFNYLSTTSIDTRIAVLRLSKRYVKYPLLKDADTLTAIYKHTDLYPASFRRRWRHPAARAIVFSANEQNAFERACIYTELLGSSSRYANIYLQFLFCLNNNVMMSEVNCCHQRELVFRVLG